MVQRYDELVAGLRTQVGTLAMQWKKILRIQKQIITTYEASYIYYQVNSGIQERTRLRKELWNNNELLHASGGMASESKKLGKSNKKSFRGKNKEPNQR